MELLDLIDIFESSVLHRRTVDSRKGIELTAYKADSNDISIQINEEVHNNLIQVCFKHDNNNIYLYVNNTLRRNRTKYNINDILNIQIT